MMMAPAQAIPENSSQDFFEQGQDRLEREIQILREQNSQSSEKKPKLLKIDESARPGNPSLREDERQQPDTNRDIPGTVPSESPIHD